MVTLSLYWTRLCERRADRNSGLGDDFPDLCTLFAARRKGADDFRRTLNHSENGLMTLDALLSLYDWHGRHHVAHITSLRERLGW